MRWQSVLATRNPVNQNPDQRLRRAQRHNIGHSVSHMWEHKETDSSKRQSVKERERGGGGEKQEVMGGQIRPGVPLKKQKENKNSCACRKRRMKTETRGIRRVSSPGRIDPLCQQLGDADFSPVTMRGGERGRTRCFPHRWGRFQP